ncbi:YbaB/EbfC family nucleoid-associated protein [Anaerosalibacter bizertensis]|uniref:Nucleoid-associated protein FYJ27_07155 n=1 Tax=Anaerosalibacter bizertensis TaxID=932217 RepID=A0A844FHP0_9FIRM|nr:YbaB/EbfC family nucleoid-associated protein [Anaerosalibacter bizertensis]MBV1817987.1 YbaB/EbfC family nucleoid-associated protein [Bacteroidales bacterium MSK.15.36]HHV27100.1 YbaB/EbfC family nucleoid-associated protein [Tissierellia bacterium]MBU5294644.1 YbaB/EbfC family nucleoid-associated protein [Anaerosalibacter bizertensis]MCB5559344.1 YbaB/EbfC family nucleoid-associated protein [Anaerosalibacter bizertensis]MCG4565209.1 YbaB/EbfC family nucleoid-associated protein [Anaerosaliba
MARGGFPGMGNMGGMMKQVQKMQKEMAELQEKLEEKEIEASAGGGAVTAVANGKKQVVSITIDEDVVDPDDIEMLQDLVLAAVNEALRSAEDYVSKEMQKITGGMNIPGLF